MYSVELINFITVNTGVIFYCKLPPVELNINNKENYSLSFKSFKGYFQ